MIMMIIIHLYYKWTGSAKGFNFGLSFLQENFTSATEPMYRIDRNNNRIIKIKHNDYNDQDYKSNASTIINSCIVSSNVDDKQPKNHSHHNHRDGDYDDDKWVLIVNNDIAFYPHTLKHITITVQKQLSQSNLKNANIGFTNLCCGSEWSAVIFTKRLVNKVRVYIIKNLNLCVHKYIYLHYLHIYMYALIEYISKLHLSLFFYFYILVYLQ